MAKNEWNGTERNGMEWNGLEWNEMDWNGMECIVLEWNGMYCIGMKWNILEWIGLVWTGLEWNDGWNGMEWHGMAQKLPVSEFKGGLAQKLRFHIFSVQILREVSHESFVFTSSTFRLWRRSRTKASFSHLQLLDFEGGLARKLRFHIFNFQFLREVSHESFLFTSSTFSFWGKKSRTKCVFES